MKKNNMSSLQGKTIVLGVTGGIAAYKACDLTSRLRKAGAQVFVVMTSNACHFVSPQTFETLSANPTVTDTFERPERWEVGHVSLARKADLFVIAPATANFMAKMACGIADDMLTTTVLAARCPVIIAPAMNTAMWENAATQHNLQVLTERGCITVGPEGGYLACGDQGSGRMSEPESIFAEIEKRLRSRQDMSGIKVLVTAGPTREMIDPVRFITNRSSGKMGYALAEAARDRGAKVTLVSGPVSLKAPTGVTRMQVLSTNDLLKAVTENCTSQDILIQAAAPADFTPIAAAEQKIKKKHGENLVIEMCETPDTAKACGEMKRDGQVFIGFAAETENLTSNAQKKRLSKNLDMICLNDVSRKDAGFDVDTNCLTLITAEGQTELPLMSKRDAADRILDKAMDLYDRAHPDRLKG